MKTLAQFVRTTILGGVIFLAPIVVLIVILAKAFGYAKTGIHAVVVHIPGVSDLSVGVATTLSIATIALVCLLAGLIAQTVIAQRLVNVIGGFGAVEDSSLRVSETGERKRPGRRRDWGASRCVRAHGRGMAARRSNRSVEQRPRLDLRPRRAEPALRLGLFLFDGHCSACGHQARRWARLPQAMRRRRIRSRRQLAIRRLRAA